MDIDENIRFLKNTVQELEDIKDELIAFWGSSTSFDHSTDEVWASDAKEVLDAYCPECYKIYCRAHYDINEKWEEGFYDCSYGTCPNGHRRMIDD